MKKKLFYILIPIILISICAILYFYNRINTYQKCPEDYADTDTGLAEKIADMDKWTNNFYDSNPKAMLSDWSKARYEYWINNNCKEALERYEEVKDGNADPTKMNLIKETINNN
jgi:hypothetical protein